MGGRGGFVAVMAVLVAATLLQSSMAVTYNVGDNFGWQTPNNGDTTYTNWAAQHTFRVGDVLVFNFVTGVHTAARVTRDAFRPCRTSNPISIQTTGPANFTLESAESYYFICTTSNHCSSGQRFAINVISGAGSPTGSPGSSPTPPGTTNPPPPPNSAPPMAAGAFSVLILVAMAMVL